MCIKTNWKSLLCHGGCLRSCKYGKKQFSTSRLVLSGVLRRRDVSWQRIEAENSRYKMIAQSLVVTFVDPNSWVNDWDFGRDDLHINRRRARHVYSRVWGSGGGRQKMRREWQCLLVGTSSEGRWGDGDEDNPGILDVGLVDGLEWYGDSRYGEEGDWRWNKGGMHSDDSGAHDWG
jgi:hypothetical protein